MASEQGLRFRRDSPGSQEEIEHGPRENHGQAEDLTDGDQPEVKTDVRIGLPDVLDEEADGPIPHQVVSEKSALERPLFPQGPEDHKKEDPLEEGLIELGGVAKGSRHVEREVHAPGNVGCPAPELAVDEV